MRRFTSPLSVPALLVVLLVALPATTRPLQAGGDHWPLDHAHSRVTFSVTKWGFAEVEGRFRDFSGAIAYNPVRPEFSHVDWTVRVASVDTGETKRDQSLLASDYFDATRYPEIRFTSESVRKAGASLLDVDGRLTLRGVTRPLTIRVAYAGRTTVPQEGTFDRFTTTFTVNRYDFGIRGGSLLGPAISPDVKITLTAVSRQPGR
jgi:polyisoprenoid-binding protein YceI